MKQYLFLGLAALLLSAAACNKNNDAASFQLDKTFTLDHNVSIPWEEDAAVSIRFDSTVADSRCPVDAICVWAGRVEVKVSFTQAGNSQTKILALGDNAGTTFSNIVTFDDFTVELLSVLPAPKSDYAIPQNEYKIEVVVKKS